jgi:poly(3-hydroxybutyrate) depolymerase
MDSLWRQTLDCRYLFLQRSTATALVYAFFFISLRQPTNSLKKIFVYPNGVGGTWAGPSYAKVSIAEDIQFVKDLLVDLHTNFSVDSKRIYATGLSNGGGFVGVIACSDVSAHFAALAPVAGAYYTDINGPNNGCAPARSPLPLMEIHGGSDKTVNYTGGAGEGGQLPSITDWYVHPMLGMLGDIKVYELG